MFDEVIDLGFSKSTVPPRTFPLSFLCRHMTNARGFVMSVSQSMGPVVASQVDGHRGARIHSMLPTALINYELINGLLNTVLIDCFDKGFVNPFIK